jgi:DNA-directed RNA polymerase subunit L
MKDNVIKFPKIKLDTQNAPQSLEEVYDKIEEYKRDFADEISEILWNLVLSEMSRAGAILDPNNEEIFPSLLLLLESIKSLYLHSCDIEHPLQDFASEAFANNVIVYGDNGEIYIQMGEEQTDLTDFIEEDDGEES